VIAVDGMDADVEFFGVRRRIRLDIVDEPVSPGDYVLNHVGFAIRRIPEGEIGATLALFDAILADAAPTDLMRADVQAEIAASGAAEGGRR
jgi:hydrogenase expression/formation protein HypC